MILTLLHYAVGVGRTRRSCRWPGDGSNGLRPSGMQDRVDWCGGNARQANVFVGSPMTTEPAFAWHGVAAWVPRGGQDQWAKGVWSRLRPMRNDLLSEVGKENAAS